MIYKKTITFTVVFLLFLTIFACSVLAETVKIADKNKPLVFIYGENGTITYDPNEIYSENSVHAVFYPNEDGTVESLVVGAANKKTDKLLLNKSFLKEEGYLTKDEKVPVIISLNMSQGESKEEQGMFGIFGLGIIQEESEEKPFEEAKIEVSEILEDSNGKIKNDLEIIDAISAEVPLDELKNLTDSEAVEKVYLDKRVRVFLDDSVPLINATRVWQLLDSNNKNVTGKDVTIAIIDTGIDYTHPDLGGCFGSSCKVVGGYDVYNSDSNPMDDHGHGTHCAGIASSNGTLKGVAPDAKLYAYKVLSSGGSGSYSQVITGIQRATDPDQDGNYSDHVNVMSLSLGGYGDEDDALSQAIDTAVDRGVVAVIAVGNSGSSSYTIMSPGCARKGIGVGATDKNDQIAYFSSRGPTSKYNIKPDLVAPGVSICSSQYDSAWSSNRCYDNQHVAISGTSMATPHVAGAAALLLQYHPDWTPQMVKSALMTTSKDLGLSVWDQGTGRIDVYKASLAEIATYPQSISFGTVNGSSISQIFTIQNLGSGNLAVNISVGNAVSTTGAQYNVSYVMNASTGNNVTSATLAPGNTTFNFTANVGNIEGTFYGYINISTASATYRVPYGFVRMSQLTVNVTGTAGNALNPTFILVHNVNLTYTNYVYGWYVSGGSYTFNLPADDYIVHAIGDMENYTLVYLLTANVTVGAGQSPTVNLSLADARVFNVTAYGLNNNILDLYKWQYLLRYSYGSRQFTTSSTFLGFDFHGDRLAYVSNSSENTSVSFSYVGYPYRSNSFGEPSYIWASESFDTANETYLMSWFLQGVNGSTDTVLDYTTDELATFNYTYNYPGKDPHLNASWLSGSYSAIIFFTTNMSSFDVSGWYGFAPPLQRTFFVKGGSRFEHYIHINYLHNDTLGGDWRSEFGAAVGQNEHDTDVSSLWTNYIKAGNSKQLYHGSAPYMPTGFQNAGMLINVTKYLLKGYNNQTYVYKSSSVTWWSSTGETGTIELPKPVVSIYGFTGAMIYNGSTSYWTGLRSWDTSYYTTAGEYTVNISIPSAYPLSNQTIITAKFDTSREDNDPPILTKYYMQPRFEYNKSYNITFDMADTGISNVSAYYSLDRGNWAQAPVSNQSNRFNLSINVTTAANELNLKIFSNDTSGNEVNYTLLPVAMRGHNVSLNFTASNTVANPGDTIRFSGRIYDTVTGEAVTGVRIIYRLNNSEVGVDKSSMYDNWVYDSLRGGHIVSMGQFETAWIIPSNYPSAVVNFDAVFEGTGVYMPNTTSILIAVNFTLPTYSTVIKTPTSPDANDVVQFNLTWTNAQTVLFGSNYTGTYTYYNASNEDGLIFYYTIPANSTAAGAVVAYGFKANNSEGAWSSTPNYTYTVQEIATNVTSGQTLLGVDLNQNNTLWCDYTEVGGDDIIGATVYAYMDTNKTMNYNSSDKRYEYVYYVSGSPGDVKTWTCYANKTNYTSQSVTSSFAIQNETDIPAYSNVARTLDPIYNNMNVTMNATWVDNAGLSVVIFSSNYTNTWRNYTVATAPVQPYNASFTILSGNLSSNQVVGWKFIANDTSNNWNAYMPVQTFTVRNRGPWVAFDCNETDKGWGQSWTFKCNCSDPDRDAVNISLWSKPPGGNWALEETQGTNGTLQQVTFGPSQFFNTSYIGSTAQAKCNVTDGKGGTNETSAVTITVEKDDVEVNITKGSGETVRREDNENYNYTITLEIRAYDTDRGEYIDSPSGNIYVTKTGTNKTLDVFNCTSYANGTCSVRWNPPDDSTVGAQYFFGGTRSNVYYKDVNSSQASFTVLGTLAVLVNGPNGLFNRASIIYLNTTTVEDPFRDENKILVKTSDLRLEYKFHEVAGWERCANVTEAAEANYYCSLDTSNLTFGWYDIRYSAEKANYTSFINTHPFKFRIMYIQTFYARQNFTANTTTLINATDVNATVEIKSYTNLTDVDINITLNSTNPAPVNLTVRELGRYLSINVSSRLADNLSFAVIKVDYTDEEVNGSGMVESSLRLYQCNGTDWLTYNNQSNDRIGGVSTSGNYVWANVTGFSDFGVGGLKDDGQSCSASSECNSGNCAEDYDSGGAWCAPAGKCAHDYVTTYADGATTCYENYKQTCDSGQWLSELCTYGCSNGDCGSAPGSGGGGGGAVTGGGAAVSVTIKKTHSLEGLKKAEGVKEKIMTQTELKKALEQIVGKLTDEKIDELSQSTVDVVKHVSNPSRTLTTETGKSTLSLSIAYHGSEKLKNFMIYDTVPKTFANSSDGITVVAPGAMVSVVRKDPVYTIAYPELTAGQKMEVNYTVSKKVDPAVINDTSDPIIFAEKFVEERLICIQVITLAINPATGECREFPTPCDVPEGWAVVNKCPERVEMPAPARGPNVVSALAVVITILFAMGLLFWQFVFKHQRKGGKN